MEMRHGIEDYAEAEEMKKLFETEYESRPCARVMSAEDTSDTFQHLNTALERKVEQGTTRNDLLEGSIGAAGFRESAGREV